MGQMVIAFLGMYQNLANLQWKQCWKGQNMMNNAVYLITIQHHRGICRFWGPKWVEVTSGSSEREHLVVGPRANEGQRSNMYKSTWAALAPNGPVRSPGAKDHFTLNSQIFFF